MKEIDLLVTGLPVSQFQDKDLRKDLENRFSGEHRVTSKRTVNIKKVLVVAQRIEGLLDYVNEVNDGPEEDCITDENRILVTDPGFYCPNWVSIRNDQLQRQLSGKSINPSPVLLELAGKIKYRPIKFMQNLKLDRAYPLSGVDVSPTPRGNFSETGFNPPESAGKRSGMWHAILRDQPCGLVGCWLHLESHL